MTEPTIGILGLSLTGGITVVGVATGLHPEFLFAGIVGALWAQSDLPSLPPLHRLFNMAVGCLVGAFLAPVILAAILGIADSWKVSNEFIVPQHISSVAAMFSSYLVCLKIVGAGLAKIAQKNIDRLAGGDK